MSCSAGTGEEEESSCKDNDSEHCHAWHDASGHSGEACGWYSHESACKATVSGNCIATKTRQPKLPRFCWVPTELLLFKSAMLLEVQLDAHLDLALAVHKV
jgi:hypothetical protein